MKWAPLLATGFILFAGIASADSQHLVRISKFSGKPVPRFETLKYAAANGRAGPSRAHPVIWLYERKGLPMLIVKESEDWRRVRDPSGDEVWMHARMLEPGSAAMVQSAIILHEKPDLESPEVARVEQGVLAKLGTCADNWCRIETGGFAGWARQNQLWGAETSEAGL